ncbi:hypothetical protein QML58_15175 [Providencia rettgeri]|nr:hypothetical protein [Providencia rettgeri]
MTGTSACYHPQTFLAGNRNFGLSSPVGARRRWPEHWQLRYATM